MSSELVSETLTELQIAQLKPTINVLVLTANDYEKKAVSDQMNPLTIHDKIHSVCGHHNANYRIGVLGVCNVVHVHIPKGSAGKTHIGEAIGHWNPKVVIMVGLMMGIEKPGIKKGDVIVAKTIYPFAAEHKRENGLRIPRHGVYSCGPLLLSRFQQIDEQEWQHELKSGGFSKIHIGQIMSGPVLHKDKDYIAQLIHECSTEDAIGCEMEGESLYSACHERGVNEWILVKGVSDFGYDKNDPQEPDSEIQPVAAKAAVSLCLQLLGNRSQLRALNVFEPPATPAIPATSHRLSDTGELLVKYLERMRDFALARLCSMADRRSLRDLAHIDVLFASRFAIDDEEEAIKLPQYIIEQSRNSSRRFERFVITAGAGSGKTTLVYRLLYELADADFVHQCEMVPVLANCVTLSQLVRAIRLDESCPDNETQVWEQAIEKWSNLVILPGVHRAESDSPADRLLRGLANQGFKLLLLVDGLDELDPSGLSVGETENLLAALHNKCNKIGIPYEMIATTRKSKEVSDQDERVKAAKRYGMWPVALQPISDEEIKRLAQPSLRQVEGVTGATFACLVKTFRNLSIDSKIVYLRPLVRFFCAQREKAEALDGTISNGELMQGEVDTIIFGISEEIKERCENDPRLNTIDLEAELRHLLLKIALVSLDRYNHDSPGSLSKKELIRMAALPSIAPVEKVSADTIAQRLLSMLSYASLSAGDKNDYYYRLPHNEHRDYLLADGIVRWVCGGRDARLIEQWDVNTIADLVCSYAYAEQVKNFLSQRLADLADQVQVTPQEFMAKLVAKMNQDLLNREPDDRNDASPHGAMLSLLLSFGPPPRGLKVEARDKCFQGTRVPSLPGNQRVRLPLAEDCQNASFSESDLRRADLSGLDFTGANFDNAQVNGASLINANFAEANLRNIAMGTASGLPSDLTGARFERADWFNYRFQGLKGYFHFWDIEPIDIENTSNRFILVSGSRGQILLFDLDGQTLEPLIVQTSHVDEVMDISQHPTERIIVTTSRDCSVRIYQFPAGDISTWPRERAADGTQYVRFIEVAKDDSLFGVGNYPRRAQFSTSGDWLAVIARDPRVAFLRIHRDWTVGERVFGQGHTGPVMCLVADPEPNAYYGAQRNADRFFTAGYDGRIAIWLEDSGEQEYRGWQQPNLISDTVRAATKTEIFRSLAPNAGLHGLWAGTELNRQLLLFKFTGDSLRQTQKREFEAGVFSVAIEAQAALLAVGLSNGRVKVFRRRDANSDLDDYNWEAPLLDVETNGEIVRSLQFIKSGSELLAATWDACLFRFSLDNRTEVSRFEYDMAGWRPREDANQIQFNPADDPLKASQGISSRMQTYLLQTNQQRITSNDK